MRSILIFFLLFLISCGKRERNAPQTTQINIDSLLDYHIAVLSKRNALLIKVSDINRNVQTTEIRGQKINWAKELEAFRVISSINKPIHSSSYTVKLDADKTSNLTVKTWEGRQDVPLKILKVYFLKDYSQVKRVEATIEQRNFVFSSTKQLGVDFSVLDTDRIVDNYEVSGHQMFFWGGPQYFSLEGHISIK